MTDNDSPEDRPKKVYQLDTRQAELGADLRRLYGEMLDEPLPNELRDLADALEKVVNRRIAESPSPGEPDKVGSAGRDNHADGSGPDRR